MPHYVNVMVHRRRPVIATVAVVIALLVGYTAIVVNRASAASALLSQGKPAMASSVSIRSLAQNRQHRLIWCLTIPFIARPMLASDTRSTRMAAPTRIASVLA